MAAHTQAKHICYVTSNPHNKLVRQHIRVGGRAVALEEGINGHMISIYDNGSHMPLLWTHLIPATLEGRALHNVENAMFAAAMAFSMGVSLENIRQGLRTFDTSFFQAPGRMNIFDKLGFKVILDYGHNPAAIQAMCELTDRLDCRGKRVCVLAAPGDRRNEDIAEIATIASGHFDKYVCRQDDRTRGRPDGEIPRLLKEALLKAGVAEDKIQCISSEQEAVNSALHQCEDGDLLLIFADKITRSWKQIIYFHDQVKGAEPSDTVGVVGGMLGEPGDDFLQDERGVFLATQEND
jgi:cyanophycin synthetase